MNAAYLKAKHQAGLSYAQYVTSGKPQQCDDWKNIYDAIDLNDRQKQLVSLFTRKINVIAVSGLWCGDCVQQGPLAARIAQANPAHIDLRWLDRDEHMDLQEKVRINGGDRVPVLLFCAEDYELVSWYGDRTLSRYRAMSHEQQGANCPLPGAPVPPEQLACSLADWLEQFERVHLLLRLSGRLRQLHGD